MHIAPVCWTQAAEGEETVEATEGDLDFDAEEAAALARAIGIGAVKYADLSINRESNYRFSYDKMLALSGPLKTHLERNAASKHAGQPPWPHL